MENKPLLWIVIPCYNEEAVLPVTAPLFLNKINSLAAAGKISDQSRICFVNDGSKDSTWQLICDFARKDPHYIGISQSRNRGPSERRSRRSDGGQGQVRHYHFD